MLSQYELKVIQGATGGKLGTVHWRNHDGTTGHGEKIDLDSANDWVKEMNKKHPTMKHWVERPSQP